MENCNTLTLLSPAKVNLFFRVLHRRADGFHAIASLYQAIDLFDQLTITLSDSDQLTCTDPQIPTDESNLLFKALSVFRHHTGWDGHVQIHLDKKIPIQSGLGGGSGNAATLLWALKTLTQKQIPDSTLAEWAATFSSDASFFLSQGTAYCTGRGEIFENLSPLRPIQMVIAKPLDGLATPSVYRQCRPDLLEQRDPIPYVEQALSGQISLFNDLESAAFDLMPPLALFKEKLLQLGFESVCMTGSGSAMMCLSSDPTQPLLGLKEQGIAHHCVRFINRPANRWYGS